MIGWMSVAFAEEPVAPLETPAPLATLNASSAVAFGDVLFREHDPFNALTAYRLGLFLEPDRPDAPAVLFRMALCYEVGHRHEAATSAWLDLAGRFPEWSPPATYRAAMTAVERGAYPEARLYLDEVKSEAPESLWAQRSGFQDAVVQLRAGDLDNAKVAFTNYPREWPTSPWVPRAEAAAMQLDAKRWHRSPALAGVFSTLIPGSGQLYAGHEGDAFMAFVANGTLAFWSYALLREGIEDGEGWKTGTGTALGTMALFGWTSNVIGAARGAKRANDQHERRLVEAVLEAADDKGLESDPIDVALP